MEFFLRHPVDIYQVYSKNGFDYIVIDDPGLKPYPKFLTCLVLDREGKAIIEGSRAKTSICIFHHI